MSTFFESTEGVTVPSELNAIPWTEVKGKRQFSLQLGLAIGDDDLSFQDPVFLHDFPYGHCAVRLTSLDFGESVSNLK
jgi:hypothetical protein